MKIRLGFVSNSSSSSFLCVITGNIEGGYDLSLKDAGMADCVKGHTFTPYGYEEVDQYIEDNPDEGRYHIPELLCPVCNGRAKGLIMMRLLREMKSLGIQIEDFK